MKFSHRIADQYLEFECESFRQDKDALILHGGKVSIQVPLRITEYYKHGWQSWSLSTWIDPGSPPVTSHPKPLIVLQSDQQYSGLNHPHGSWMGAVTTIDGITTFLGSLGFEAHVELKDNTLIGTYETGEGDWYLSLGEEQTVFKGYITRITKKLGKSKVTNAPKVWCSWYSMYEEICEDNLIKVIDDLVDYPIDVVQIDDGWQQKVGDWNANSKFPSGMRFLANQIKRGGKIAGLWLAPFLVVPSSKLYIKHKDWLLLADDGKPASAGFNWHEQLYALDTTHPQVLNWITNLMIKIRDWGFDYIKLDFLYAGALKGNRHQNIPREAAFRLGLQTMREALGDAFLLTCGAPILPSIGLSDAIRIGPDVSGSWSPYIENKLLRNYSVPSVQNAIRTSLNRLWLKPVVHTDPDVVYFQESGNSLSSRQKHQLRSLAKISNFKATSEIPHLNTTMEKEELFSFFRENPQIYRTNKRHVYKINDQLVDFVEDAFLLPKLNILELILQKILYILSDHVIFLKIFGRINSCVRRRKIRKLLLKTL
ncbi:glycoside hydrolase family 36 protein [Chloroflexota bacterium]